MTGGWIKDPAEQTAELPMDPHSTGSRLKAGVGTQMSRYDFTRVGVVRRGIVPITAGLGRANSIGVPLS